MRRRVLRTHVEHHRLVEVTTLCAARIRGNYLPRRRHLDLTGCSHHLGGRGVASPCKYVSLFARGDARRWRLSFGNAHTILPKAQKPLPLFTGKGLLCIDLIYVERKSHL